MPAGQSLMGMKELPALLGSLGIGFYALGFLIWEIHTSTYGISGPSLFQGRFVSAGLCYFAFVVMFVMPFALLFEWFGPDRTTKSKPTATASRDQITLLVLWLFLLMSALPRLLPSVEVRVWGLAPVTLSGLAITIAPFVRGFADSKFFKVVNNPWFSIGGTILLLLVAVWVAQPKLGAFLILSAILWPAIHVQGRASRTDLWQHPSVALKMISISLCGFLALSHAICFGQTVFPMVPGSFGGGAPQIVYFIPGSSRTDLFWAAGFPITNDAYGPFEVITQDEHRLWIQSPLQVTNSARKSAVQFSIESTDILRFESRNGTKVPTK